MNIQGRGLHSGNCCHPYINKIWTKYENMILWLNLVSICFL